MNKIKIKLIVLLTIFSTIFSYGQTACELRWDRFSKDVNGITDTSKALVSAIDENSDIITSWWIMDEVGETALRTNVDELQYLSIHLKEFQKIPESVVEEIEKAGGFAKWKDVANAGGGLIKRLDELSLSVLTKKLDDLGDATKAKFFDDFADISDDGLKILDKKINLIDHWKNYKQYFLDKKYRAPDDIDIDQVYNSLSEGGMKEMVKKVNEILPPFKNGSYVISGGYHSKLDDIVIKNNIPKVDGVKNERKFNKLVEGLEPELREHVEYLDFIREDFKAHKALDQESKKGVHNKLLNIAKGKENKLIQAGKPGSHAEVQVVNEIIKKLRQKGENINLEEIFLYVKNKNNRNMCRCPNCFYILKNKVKMIGNE
ncbi:hypothetical protein [Tenacibaculum maritimum]|uniref:hypothetical protein n=3 Tax=Tenacibaculum maritimum TaxID=107401 RepID=UPI001F1DC4F9|nr:hypothetical protein [Tenacibaculum maritimum]